MMTSRSGLQPLQSVRPGHRIGTRRGSVSEDRSQGKRRQPFYARANSCISCVCVRMCVRVRVHVFELVFVFFVFQYRLLGHYIPVKR